MMTKDLEPRTFSHRISVQKRCPQWQFEPSCAQEPIHGSIMRSGRDRQNDMPEVIDLNVKMLAPII